jgi:hypothetical protein
MDLGGGSVEDHPHHTERTPLGGFGEPGGFHVDGRGPVGEERLAFQTAHHVIHREKASPLRSDSLQLEGATHALGLDTEGWSAEATQLRGDDHVAHRKARVHRPAEPGHYEELGGVLA